MGQPSFIYLPINPIKARSEYRSPNNELCSEEPEPTNKPISRLVKIKAQRENKSPTGELCLKDRSESPNELNKCLAVGFAPKMAPNNCTKWILDSGATDHMTGNQTVLRNYRFIQNDQYFTVANNEKIKIKGWGMISIFPKYFLQDVFFVENCSVNLLFISKVTKELNCEIIFKENIVIFQDLITKEKTGKGFLENGVYFLDSNKSSFNITKDGDLEKL
jgi:hypothetical protein